MKISYQTFILLGSQDRWQFESPENMQYDATLYDDVRRYAARLLSDFDAAQDVTQEVFLRLEQQDTSCIGNLRAWVYRTARNLVIDRFRRSGRTTDLPDDLPADVTLFNPAAIAERKEQSQMLETKMNELPPRQREVLRLKFQEGLKYAEIAEVLGEPVTTVAWLIHEAVAKLRAELTA